MTTVVYTDGACSGNPGPGGWAWAIPGGAFGAGFAAHTTNQRMEVQAAFEAVKSIAGPVEVVSDSTYVINCFQKRWWEGWLRNGWKNSAKKPVANRDLWEPFIEHVRGRGSEITFRWVKGHSGDPMNDLVDGLAVEAGKKQAPRSGDKPPTGSLPADTAGKVKEKATASTPKLDGHLVLVTGHKPPALGGYDDNPISDRVKVKLSEILTAKKQIESNLVVVSGLGLGAEQLGAESAVESGLPLAVVLPFPGQEEVWPAASKERYETLISKADQELLLEATKPNSKQAAGMALGRRENWLARNVQEAVVVWDGQDPTVGRLVTSLQDHLGDDQVWVIAP